MIVFDTMQQPPNIGTPNVEPAHAALGSSTDARDAWGDIAFVPGEVVARLGMIMGLGGLPLLALLRLLLQLQLLPELPSTIISIVMTRRFPLRAELA